MAIGSHLRPRLKWVTNPSFHYALLLVVSLSTYLLSLAPGLLGGDAGEFQTAAHVLGLPHPTGYPLYLLLVKLWSLLPIASVAYRVNLLAAVLATLAVLLFYTALRFVTRQGLVSVAIALTLAFSPLFWSQGLIADKYALNALLICGLLVAVVRWLQAPQIPQLCLLALALGLGLAHHRTTILFVPGLVGLVLWSKPPGRALGCKGWELLCLLLPLGLYAYLPLVRLLGQPLSNWWPATFGEWLSYFFARGHWGESPTTALPLLSRLTVYGRTLTGEFTPWGLILAIGGCYALARRQRPLLLFILLSFGLQAALSIVYYQDVRNHAFFLPSFLLVAFSGGIGGAAILRWARKRLDGYRPSRTALIALVTVSLCLLPVVQLGRAWPEMHHRYRRDQPLDIWRQDLTHGAQASRLARLGLSHAKPQATVLCDWEQATAFRYLQLVERLRPDVQILYPINRLDEVLDEERPLYVARSCPGLADRWHLSASGPLIALHAEPISVLPTNLSPLGTLLGESFELAGFTYDETEFELTSVVPLSLYWRAIQDPDYDYSVSLRLFDEKGRKVFQVDSQHPVLGTYPTSQWSAGEVVSDYYEIPLLADWSPGIYRWGVILYRSLPDGGWENLGVAGTGDEIAWGGSFEVQKP